MPNKTINLVAQNPQSTVVAEFTPSKKRAEHSSIRIFNYPQRKWSTIQCKTTARKTKQIQV